MRPNYRQIRPNYRHMRSNFGFSKDYYSFHASNTIRSNFSEFHRIFPNFPKNRRDRSPPNFLLHTNFQTLISPHIIQHTLNMNYIHSFQPRNINIRRQHFFYLSSQHDSEFLLSPGQPGRSYASLGQLHHPGFQNHHFLRFVQQGRSSSSTIQSGPPSFSSIPPKNTCYSSTSKATRQQLRCTS
jgi:hypothetical protein